MDTADMHGWELWVDREYARAADGFPKRCLPEFAGRLDRPTPLHV